MTYFKIFRKRQLFLCFIFLFCFAQLMAKEEGNINIKKGEIRNKEEEIKDFKNDSEEVGSFAKTANAVVLVKEKKVKNDGKITSRLTGTAKEVKGSSKEGAMHVEGQGNGVVSIGYSPFSNNRDVNKQLELIENNGSINVNSTFQGGKAEVHGFVETVATGNGVLLYGLSDYGSTIGGDGGSGSSDGGVDSLGGGSKPVRIRRPVIKNKALPVTTTATSNATTLNSNNSRTEKQNENSDNESSETDKNTGSSHNFGSAYGSSDSVNPALAGWLAPTVNNKDKKQEGEKKNKNTISSDTSTRKPSSKHDFGSPYGSSDSVKPESREWLAPSSPTEKNKVEKQGKEKEKEKKNGKNKPKDTTKIDEVDLHGKNNVMTLLKMDNKGDISVNLDIKTSEGYKRETSTDLNGHKVEEHIQPQWRSIATLSSGNGISGLSYVTTPTRRTYGEDKENRIEIKEIDNNGNISAKSNFKTSDYATVNYIHTFATGNGISALAYTNNNAKNKTYAIIDKITNTGTISGKVNSEVGSNTSSGFHEYSTNKMNATGNGISVYAHNSNGQVKESDARIENLLNSGSINGNILAKAGKGYGDLSAKIVASGNGVSVYSTGTNQKSTLKKLENSGYIVGHAVVYGGLASGSEKENQTKFNIEITSKKDKKKEDNKKENCNPWLAPESGGCPKEDKKKEEKNMPNSKPQHDFGSAYGSAAPPNPELNKWLAPSGRGNGSGKEGKEEKKEEKREMTSPSSSSPFKTTLEDFKPKNNGGKSENKPKESLRQPEMSKPAVTQPVVSKPESAKSSGNPFDDKDLSKWRQPAPKVDPRKPTNHHNDAYGISSPKEREDLSKWLYKPNSDKEKEKKTDSAKPDNKKPETPTSKPKPPKNPYSDAYGLTYGGLSNIGVRPNLKPKPKQDNKANDQGGWKKPDNCDPFATPGHPRSCYPPNNNKPKKRGRRALPDNNDAYGINYNGLNGIGNIPTLAPKKENKKAESPFEQPLDKFRPKNQPTSESEKNQTGSNNYADIHKKKYYPSLN